MSRHIQWGLIIPLTLLIIIVAASPVWIDFLEPYIVEEDTTSDFICPTEFNPEECAVLTAAYIRSPEEADAAIAAIAAGSVPAPANEVEAESIREGTDSTTAAEFTEIPVRVGEFTEIDPIHMATGRATIWELVADGDVTRVLRFDNNFSITPGPDLHVYLSAHQDPRTKEDLELLSLQVEISGIKGNIGSQNYVLDEDIDITRFDSVVIYSPTYEVIYSTAPLQQPIQ